MSDTGEAKLPGIPVLRTTDRAIAAWAQAVTEHLEVRAGSRGNLMEKAVVGRDIASTTKVIDELTRSKPVSQTDITVELGAGVTGVVRVNTLVDHLLANQKFKNAIAPVDVTKQESTNPGEAAMNRIASDLSARIDSLSAAKKRIADDAFYISNPSTGTAVGGGGPTFGGGGSPVIPVARHPDAIALKETIVLYNDINIKELFTDLYNMIYAGNGATGKPVKLHPASVLNDGQTIQDWAAYMYATRMIADRALARAEQACTQLGI